jgi:hypothetical protein
MCSPDEVEGKGEVAGQRGVAFFGRGRGDGQTAEGVSDDFDFTTYRPRIL